MNRWLRSSTFSFALMLALAVSALWTVPALADDEAPPAPAAEETAPPAEVGPEEVSPSEELPAEAPVTEESAPQEVTATELLASVPEGTEVVVVNEEGENVPLATQEAADAIEFVDPVWCPTGVTPQNGTGGCTTSYGSLKLLVDALIAGTAGVNPAANGIIWIQGGTDTDVSGTPIVIDGSDPIYNTWENFSLTLKGGWSGTLGTTTVNTATPSILDQPISIINWNGAITLSDIVISGASGAGIYALDVETTKNITLTNVDMVNNTTANGGAYLNNTAGTGNVVVNDSTFSGNSGASGFGLAIYSNGTITGKNLSANDNTMSGAYFDNNSATTAKAVTLTGSNNFKFNGTDGLVVLSQGAITLSNVTALYNSGGFGAFLDNCVYNFVDDYCDQMFPSAVTFKGTSNFSNNGWDGLRVWSGGAITVNNITANDNGTDAGRPGQANVYDATGKGAFLDNFGSFTPKAITLTGTNTFNGNASAGLFADGWGTIKANNLTANENGSGCSPAETYEEESMCDGAILDGSGVTLTGYGVSNDNYDDGMFASSYGAVTLNNLSAAGNGYWGVGISSYGPGSVVNVLGTNTFLDNLDNGLNVYGQGAVTLNNITANGNSFHGIFVDNAMKYDPILMTLVLAGKPVTVKGVNTFNGNANVGLEVHSSGVITTNSVTASFNGDGVYLDNCLFDVTDCSGLVGKAITMNGNNNFNDNADDGLYIESLGSIKVSNLTALGNDGNGAILDNNWTNANGGVTITGFANTSMNGVRGMGIYSEGAVLISNITANLNGPTIAASGDTFYRGVYINNATDPLKLMSVTLLGINQFNDNWNTGLQIASYGIVTLNNITASNNGEPYDLTNNPTPEGYGVKIDNSDSSMAKPVTLNGINIFNGNYNDGLSIESLGAIKVNKVTASYNGGNGAMLDNRWNFLNTPITIVGYGIFNGNLNGNGGAGLNVNSNGSITLSNITANFSSNAQGAHIENRSNTLTPVNVTLLGVNSFSGNYDDGLVIYSDGLITLNNVTANDNLGIGAYLNNTLYQILVPLTTRNIVLNGTNTFIGNFWDGLVFYASGSVTITRITADLNTDGIVNAGFSNGVYGTAGGSITITCGSMNLNEGAGYDLTAGAGMTVTLKGVFTYGNGVIDTSGPITVPTVRTCPLP